MIFVNKTEYDKLDLSSLPAPRLEENKKLVLSLIDALGRLDFEEFMSYLSEDVVFHTVGEHPASGIKSKSRLSKEFPALKEVIPDGLVFKVNALTAEDDRVHIDFSSIAILYDGQDYRMNYHFGFVIRDGKIVSVRDHADSEMVLRILLPAFQKYGADAGGQ